ncbi:alpha/beta hydrolase [Acetobacteraceae bacterium KSS8]|uniref:Alpha/beta hydrolase n=1 Tax=Endosaccharibacter trunci TaxID=2812733 RepID=A0ABT1WBF7_9PROT|nr:alpha/beta hydrolase [Acetobacteraceae bacterium KSS8]
MTMPHSASPITIVFMHHLGGSAETWKPVETLLEQRFPAFCLDLPGFGDASSAPGRPVEAMAEWIERRIDDRVDGPFVLVGHSMSAKVALTVAKRAEAAPPSPSHLIGLVLAAGSPPAPEPMEDSKRQEMLGWFEGDDAQSRTEADQFVRANIASPLDPEAHETALRDVLRAARQAWRHWLTDGSNEDLRERIGKLAIPALILAGAEDEALGSGIQQQQMMPHLTEARLETIDGAAHLLPLEKPAAVAALIADFVDGLSADTRAGRLTGRTRTMLERRGQSDDDYEPRVLDRNGLDVLRTVLHCILPMPDGIAIDLAAKLDAKLHEAIGDGWRFANLPPDADAYRQAIATLDAAARRAHGTGFASLPPEKVEEMLERLGDKRLDTAPIGLPDDAMRNWLLEIRGDSCQIFLTHPAVQARANILAAATGNDTELLGFAETRANQSEGWENTFWREHA